MECLCNTFMEKQNQKFYLIARVLIGFMFMLHGASKFGLIGDGAISGFASAMGLPIWLAGIVAFIELIGGLMIMLGLFTRLFSMLGAIVVLVAAIGYHMVGSGSLNPLTNNAELALLYFAGFLITLAFGGGIYSLGRVFFKKEFM